jgi:hypothetical protein
MFELNFSNIGKGMEGAQRKTESYLQDQESRWRPETRASEMIDGDPSKVGNRFWNIEMFGRQSKQPVRMFENGLGRQISLRRL